MLTLTGSLRVFLALEPCDMRKSFDGLHAEVVSRLGDDPRSGAVFVFTNRSRNLLKLLHWDPGVTLAACWAHARRKFHEAFKSGHTPAAAPLRHIQQLYQIEKTLRQTRAGPEERTCVRQAEAVPILDELHHTLLQLQRQVLPRNPVGEAAAYTLTLWTRLNLYATDGRLDIDNNNLENAFRPPAVGKRNWLFVGGEGTGQRGAILHTLLENTVRHGHNPEAWLADVLERLPAMTNRDDLEILLPSHWQSPAATRAILATCA